MSGDGRARLARRTAAYQERVSHALAELPQRDQQCMQLLAMGYSITQIAELTGMMSADVSATITRAVQHLIRRVGVSSTVQPTD